MRRTANVMLATVMCIMLVVPQGFASKNRGGVERPLRPEVVQFHQKYGTVETVSGRFPVESGATRIEKAYAFFDSRTADFRIERPGEELELLSEKTDALGLTHLRFQQVYKDVKVWGCQTIVHFEDDMTIYLVGGQTIPTPELDVSPDITAGDAEQEAIISLKDQLDHQDLETETELIIYPNDGDPRLAYLVTKHRYRP
jgi:Zn-dependent metalloprotease